MASLPDLLLRTAELLLQRAERQAELGRDPLIEASESLEQLAALTRHLAAALEFALFEEGAAVGSRADELAAQLSGALRHTEEKLRALPELFGDSIAAEPLTQLLALTRTPTALREETGRLRSRQLVEQTADDLRRIRQAADRYLDLARTLRARGLAV